MVDSHYDGPVSGYAERNGIVRGPEPRAIEKGTRVRVAECAEGYNVPGTVVGYALKYYKVKLDGFDYNGWGSRVFRCHLFTEDELEVVE